RRRSSLGREGPNTPKQLSDKSEQPASREVGAISLSQPQLHPGPNAREPHRSPKEARTMRASGWVLLVVVLAGCQRPAPPKSASQVVEPADFANWPRITEQPVRVDPAVWADCRGPTPEETARHGPHVDYTIVVRVSPEAITAFRQGRPLPVG